MLQERLLRHTLDFTGADGVHFSTDYPSHRPDAADVEAFFDSVPNFEDRANIGHRNAEALFHLA